MIWYSTFYFKYYKWLSSQNLYLLYFLNKIFVYLDFFFTHFLWIKPYSSQLYTEPKKPDFLKKVKARFFKPVTAYLITLDTKSIIINLYYKTSLEKFQAMDLKKKQEKIAVLPAFSNPVSMQNVFYR